VSTVGLHAAAAGPEGGPVVLLGGSLGTTRAMWAPQLPALARRHRVLAFDHRGHGASPVPPGPYSIADLAGDVLALMDARGIERAHYAGLSIGGMVGLWLAANAQERVGRLVLLCTSAHLESGDAYRERARAVRAAGTVEPVADAVVARWTTPAWARANADAASALRAMLVATPAEGYAACCEAIAAMDLRDQLAGIRAPTLVIAGAEDPAIPPAHGMALAAAIPGARLEILHPAAHLASIEQPQAVSALLLGHLDPSEAP